MNHVLIFRHQLFKVSEPFIVQQAERLLHFSPIYLGRDRFGDAPPQSMSLALEDMKSQRSFLRRLWQVLTRDPSPYAKLLGEYRPKLVHAHFGVEGLYALPLARKLGIPLVTTFHGFDATTTTGALIRSGSPSWLKYALSRRQLAEQGDLFLCVSKYIRQRVIEMGFPEERTRLHYIGIDTQFIQPRQSNEERPVVLHVARLVGVKGTEYLIRAFGRISAKIPDATLVIVGEGPLRPYLESLVQSLRLVARVKFLGAQHHANVLALMRKAAMLVQPSVTTRSGNAEGLGMVILEAAAVGVPLVGTRHGGIPEVIEDRRTGYLVPERDIGALEERMSSLLADDGLRLALGHQARAMVEDRFCIHKQTEQLERLYNSVIS